MLAEGTEDDTIEDEVFENVQLETKRIREEENFAEIEDKIVSEQEDEVG